MLPGCVSFVKACKDYFQMEGSTAVAEFRALNQQDKVELREGLIQVGYDVEPLGSSLSTPDAPLVGV